MASEEKVKRSRKVRTDLSQTPAVQAKVKRIPESLRNTYLKAMRGRSRNAAMRAFCQECTGYSRAQIRDCSGGTCPLYPYRPYQNGTDEPEEVVEAEVEEEDAQDQEDAP